MRVSRALPQLARPSMANNLRENLLFSQPSASRRAVVAPVADLSPDEPEGLQPLDAFGLGTSGIPVGIPVEVSAPGPPLFDEKPIVLLVVGECGDGKSTMVNALRDCEQSSEAKTGKAARGVTKSITGYTCRPINGRPVLVLDTPGIGDLDVAAASLLSLLEERLNGGADAAPIDGVLVTTPTSDAMGASSSARRWCRSSSTRVSSEARRSGTT